ncbi:PQQ-binding-like beta-propeller repeat protein [Seonamhaeicola sediminis]|uniref:PQQ-binding-like beta-propeller repeat protein n=1 Tax=Seonamhaeicola sediminis TaxID=2528206 RepID=A0A562YIE8_9FLAO|nr:PQQ-binding-like beta-propeller repeat protein [Seonamhaeicola sediminis]TWO34467.1 PQQ-binding-like beta-propeller repeat protein [Seonamhaeicola sediminis]
MRNFKKIVMLVMIMLLAHTGWTQKTTPDYQYAFDGQVKWLMLHESGTLLASTGEALAGIRPNSSEVSFKLERLKRVKEEHLEFVPNTPYVIIKPRGIFMHTVVVDVVKGKIVFDSKAENWQNGVTSRHFLYPEMMIVVNGMHKEEGLGNYTAGVGMYDLKTGKLVKIFERKGTNPMTGEPDILGDNIIIPGLKNVECYSISSGTVKWTADVKNATNIVTNEASKEVYAFRSKGDNTVVYKINADNGTSLWQEGNKIKGVISTIEFTKKGLAIVTNILSGGSKLASKLKGSGTSKVYLLDLNSGADLWDKSPKTKGIINHFYIEDDGIIFGVSDGGINKIAFDGTPRWKKPLKTGPGIQIMATVPTGLLYISETDADIIDMATGESVFGKAIKYKRSASVVSTYDSKMDRFLISCKDGVYEVDGNNGEYNLIANDITFGGKEDPTGIEVRAGGILLTSDQNLEMLDFQGGANWDVYHRAPGKSAFGAILMGALTATSMAMGSAHAARAGYMKGAGVPAYHSAVQREEDAADAYAAIADAAFQEMMKRFKATKATANASFILTKVDGGVALVKVDKDSGETINEIVIEDKDPMYEVDDIEGFLYFKDKGNNISAYNLNK